MKNIVRIIGVSLASMAGILLVSGIFVGGDTTEARANPAENNGVTPMLVKTSVPLTPEVVSAIASYGAGVTYVWPEIDALALGVTAAAIGDLEVDPLVAFVEVDGEGQVMPDVRVANDLVEPVDPIIVDPEAPLETWNLDMADVSGSGFDGTGVTVAVIDSGLPQNWEEFLAVESVDLTYATGFGSQGLGSSVNPVHAIRGEGGRFGLLPHGLAVASVIAGFPSEHGRIGGSAPGATILPIRVLSYHNTGHISWFTAAILYVANLKKDGLLPGPVVINFSIQIGPSFDVLEDAINFAIDQGILFVSIAGNWGPETPSMAFPGRLPQSISVGAVGWVQEGSPPEDWFFGDVPENDTSEAYVATFSGRPNLAVQDRLDVLAPGSLVFGQWLAETGYSVGRSKGRWGIIFNFIDGTSFAAPHVAGIVAQMLEKNPTLTQAQAEGILKSTALSVSPDPDGVSTALQIVAPWDFNATGAGLVRGTAALAVTP